MVSPESVCDSLFIMRHLEKSLRGMTAYEVHLFAYLSCLLALYSGRPVAEWGYRFTATTSGAPYSQDITESLEQLELSGHIQSVSDGAVRILKCTELGQQLSNTFDHLESWKKRSPFVDAACTSSLAFSVASIRTALSEEPTLLSAGAHRCAQPLLSGPPLEVLYEQFSALKSVLGTSESDLLIPSSIWMSYLLQVQSGSHE